MTISRSNDSERPSPAGGASGPRSALEQLPLFAGNARPPGRAPTPRLRVVRERAHVWAHAQDPAQRVWTLREFFDRIRRLAFVEPAAGVRNDDAALWACASVLSAHSGFAVRMAPDLRTLYRALVHGGVTPVEVARALGHEEGRSEEIARWFQDVSAVQGRLSQAGWVDGSEALARGVAHIEAHGLPASLRSFTSVIIEHPIDPTELEVRVLTVLAHAGLPVEVVLPLDEGRRGLGEAVAWIADVLEKAYEAPSLDVRHEGIGGHGPLRAFVDAWYAPTLMPVVEAPLRIEVCADQGEEARRIAGAAAAWRRSSWPPPRIAIALRTLDGHATRIADALLRYGVPCRWRSGPRLSETLPARVLLDFLLLRREGAPRERLLSLLGSPYLRDGLPIEQVGAMARLLREAVARADVEDTQCPRGGYAQRLQRYAASREEDDPERAAEARAALAHIERLLSLAYALPERAALSHYLETMERLLVEEMAPHDELHALVLERVKAFRAALLPLARPADGTVELAAFTKLFARALDETRAPPPPCPDDSAVELLALPELFGRSFDYVVVADCVHGRLPLAERLDPLLSDGDRKLVNQRMGRRVLRLHSTDPLEPAPVPRRQALELLWFAGAAESAQRALFLTAAARDARGREQAPSLFLQKALEALGASPDAAIAGIDLPDEPDRRLARQVAAQALASESEASALAALNDEDRQRVASVWQMETQRRAFFERPEDANPSEHHAPYAFAVAPERLWARFGRQLGANEDKPLGPTRLEALASCRMRGFIEHLLGVDTWPFPGQDGDARHLGRLAHRVLEVFLRQRAHSAPSDPHSWHDEDGAALLSLLEAESHAFIERTAPGHQGALRAHVAWLGNTLVRALAELGRAPPVPGAAPRFFELKVGTRGWQASGDGLGPVPIPIGARTLYFGGEIDRVDEGEGVRVVVDYKNSTATAVGDKVHPKALWKTHFQLPLYLRLLEHHRPTSPETKLAAYLISLREGVASRVVGEREPLRALILDDERPDGLARSIERVLSPLFEGTIVPDAGTRCSTCRLARVCRVPEKRAGTSFEGPWQPPVEGDASRLLDDLLKRVPPRAPAPDLQSAGEER